MYGCFFKKDFLKYIIFSFSLGFVVSCSSDTARFSDMKREAILAVPDSFSTHLAQSNALYSRNKTLSEEKISSIFTPDDEVSQQSEDQVAQPTSPSTAMQKAYRVIAGDTFFSIARKFGVSVRALQHANHLKSNSLRVGQKLIIPSAFSEQAAERHVFSKTVSKRPIKQHGVVKPVWHVKEEKIAQNTHPTVIKNVESNKGNVPFAWPVRGKISTRFQQKTIDGKSNGIDILVSAGSSVKAAENGVVLYSGDGLKQFGKTILIKHANNLVTVYGNNSDLEVKRGDHVYRGQEIAKSGMSGNVKRPQLHFEVRKDARPVNPLNYLR